MMLATDPGDVFIVNINAPTFEHAKISENHHIPDPDDFDSDAC